MLLVGCCVILICRWPSKATTYFCGHFFLCQFAAPSKEMTPPHTFRPGRLSSSMPLPLLMSTFGWLLCPPIKQRPSKAKGPPISLFFLSINIPPQTTTLYWVNIGIKNRRMKKYGTVKLFWCTLHISPCDRNTTHFQAHPWLCVLVVCCVLRAQAVLLGSNAYAPIIGKPRQA